MNPAVKELGIRKFWKKRTRERIQVASSKLKGYHAEMDKGKPVEVHPTVLTDSEPDENREKNSSPPDATSQDLLFRETFSAMSRIL